MTRIDVRGSVDAGFKPVRDAFATVVARHRLLVEKVVPEAPGVVSVHLRGRHLEELDCRAGQFLLARLASADRIAA